MKLSADRLIDGFQAGGNGPGTSRQRLKHLRFSSLRPVAGLAGNASAANSGGPFCGWWLISGMRAVIELKIRHLWRSGCKTRGTVFILCLLLVFFFPLPAAEALRYTREYAFSGRTMGTYYSVTVCSKANLDVGVLKSKVDTQLEMVNDQMSVFSETSEISRFNRAGKGEAVAVSHSFLEVIRTAQKLYELTDGAWDGTVKPLFDLWGFKSGRQFENPPSRERIDAAMARTGFHHIAVTDRSLVKKKAGIALDLGAIAKGYGVDAVASLLKASGYADFSVEIGGEVYAAGRKGGKHTWRVGISMPESRDRGAEPYRVVALSDRALATSGTYREFIKLDGRTYPHIINPKTGRPVAHRVVSVSVAAETCMFADGLATAVLVMGTKKGIKLVDHLDNTECMVVEKERDGTLVPYYSKGFAEMF